MGLWEDRTMDALFGPRPSFIQEIRLQAEREVVHATRPAVLGYRWINPKKEPGARGGDANRAKTKAARKANLARRRNRP